MSERSIRVCLWAIIHLDLELRIAEYLKDEGQTHTSRNDWINTL